MSATMYLGNGNISFPEWLIFHIPHDAQYIPEWCRDQFVVDEKTIQHELRFMTDLYTHEIFSENVVATNVVRAPFSRLVVDVERFAFDIEEEMACCGQGVIYSHGYTGTTLRRNISQSERQYLLEQLYYPHHAKLNAVVRRAIRRYGRAIILDCHSFSPDPLPLEPNQLPERPDICIGTDQFHTPKALTSAFVQAFAEADFAVSQNDPFSGSIVPMEFYGHDKRVMSIMVEVNRGLYLDGNGNRQSEFVVFAQKIRSCVGHALKNFYLSELLG